VNINPNTNGLGFIFVRFGRRLLDKHIKLYHEIGILISTRVPKAKFMASFKSVIRIS
jgi:hypothetical protein